MARNRLIKAIQLKYKNQLIISTSPIRPESEGDPISRSYALNSISLKIKKIDIYLQPSVCNVNTLPFLRKNVNSRKKRKKE